MEQLPYVPASTLWEMLPLRDLAAVVRTSRSLYYSAEPFLYRLHAVTPTRSAILWAAKTAQPSVPETQTTAISTLDKINKFCRVDPDALDFCYQKKASPIHIDDALDKLMRPPGTALLRFWSYPGPPWAPLHVAAWKGLDTIVQWLLEAGASVDVSGFKAITPLCLAVSNNKASTAALLLAHGAFPVLRKDDDSSPTVLHLACVMAHAELAEQLLATEGVRADPTDVLYYYNHYGKKDAPAVIELLARHGVESSNASISELLDTSRGRSALALLRSIRQRDEMSSRRAEDLLRKICCSVRRRCIESNARVAEQMIRELLGMGANPNVGHLLWDPSPPSFPAMLLVLPPFLEAGMKFKGERDLLADMSAYDKNQDKEGASAQLSVVSLLLRYGAPIGGGTRGDALGSLGARRDGRGKWAKKLCGVLLNHCRQMPRSKRGKDINAFLRRVSPLKGLLEENGLDVDFL